MSDFLSSVLSVIVEFAIALVLIVIFATVKRIFKNRKARKSEVVA